MKYSVESIIIPQEKRKEINEKIIHIIDLNLEVGIHPQDIYNAYTGQGGLHGLQRNEFENYYDYSEAKKEKEVGQFFTPHKVCQFIMNMMNPLEHDLVVDLTCGMGNFFNFVPNEHNVYGNELDRNAFKVARHLYPNAHLTQGDIREYSPSVTFDLSVLNPPFNLYWDFKKERYPSQFYCCLKSYEVLKAGGFLVLIVPQSFLQDESRDSGFIAEMNERFSFVVQFELPHAIFKHVGVASFSTKVMVFQKRSEHFPYQPYSLEKETIQDLSEWESQRLYQTYIRSLQEKKEQFKAKLFLENIRNHQADQSFEFQIKKMLYDIKVHPKLKHHYTHAVEYIHQFHSQVKPEKMDWKEWEKIKIKKEDVLHLLRSTLKNQHVVEKHEIRLVKTNDGLKLKAYSQETEKELRQQRITKEMSFNDMILQDYYPFDDPTYLPLLNKKCKAYQIQSKSLKESQHNSKIGTNSEIETFLQQFSIFDHIKQITLQLKDTQKEVLHRILSKRYGILNLEQGSGKTLCGIVWYKYLLSKKAVKNVFIVSSAISINMTWDIYLRNYKENYIKINSLQDIHEIQPYQIVILSTNMLLKYKRHIQRFVRMKSQKCALIFDESDDLTNEKAKRTATTLACFRKLKYKLLTTGTTTRNSINDLYSQIELLYNNSINMICECSQIYKIGKGERDDELDSNGLDRGIDQDQLRVLNNPYYMKPFPPYTKGAKLFKACFNPYKTTVFGVKKEGQDIYNMDELIRLIDKTIITKRFKEIAGKEIYTIHTHSIIQNEYERKLYEVIMKQFHQMLYLFRTTGSSRKDSMLRIIRQIKLLISSTSVPHLFKEYENKSILPNKYHQVFDLISLWKNEKVAIGTTTLHAVNDYQRKLQERFPNRPIYLIKGDVPFKKRTEIIREFERSKNGILLSTQQSLSKSVNIPTCNKAIIESLQWNIPKISQYYFRFIRLDSVDQKEIHFLTYDYTIEQNLLGLLMAKERLNEFIKTLDLKEQSDIFQEYDMDENILDHIIEKSKDEKGYIYLNWGQQQIGR